MAHDGHGPAAVPLAPPRRVSPLKIGCIAIVALIMALVTCGVGAMFVSMLSSPRAHDWTSGCLSADQGSLALVGDEAVLVDVRDGAIRTRFEAYFDDVACLPSGEIRGLRSRDAVSLRDRAPVPWTGSDSVVAVVDERTLLSTQRAFSSSNVGGVHRSQLTGPLELRLDAIGPGASATQVFVAPERLPGVGVGPIDAFETIFVRRLDSGEVLVLAGFRPSVEMGSPSDWGDGRLRALFRVDLATGQAVQHGSPIGTTESACLFRSVTYTRATSTADGRMVVAACSVGENRLQVLRLDPFSGTAAFVATIDQAREPIALALSPAGDRLAVSTVSPDGSTGRVTLVEPATGRVVTTIGPLNGWVYVVEWLGDGSFVLASAEQEIERRIGATGALVWSVRRP